jgi:hypothetical protein
LRITRTLCERVKIIGIQDFHPVLPLAENLMRRLVKKPFLGRREQFREIIPQANDDVESLIVGVVHEGSAGEFPIGDYVVDKAPAGVLDGATRELAGGTVLAIPRAVRLDIERQSQACSHRTDQDQPVMIAEDLSLLIPVRTAHLTNLLARSFDGGSIQGRANQAAAVEGFMTLGLPDAGHRRPPRHPQIDARGEVGECIIAKALGDLEGMADPGTQQRFNAGEVSAVQPRPPSTSGGQNAERCAVIGSSLIGGFVISEATTVRCQSG